MHGYRPTAPCRDPYSTNDELLDSKIHHPQGGSHGGDILRINPRYSTVGTGMVPDTAEKLTRGYHNISGGHRVLSAARYTVFDGTAVRPENRPLAPEANAHMS